MTRWTVGPERARRESLVETLHGVEVADPYRWLEDPDADDTRAFVEAERALGEEVLSGLRQRARFRSIMRAVMGAPRTGTPARDGGWWLMSRNDGSQPQDVVVVARDLDEIVSGSARVLVDPNTWSADGSSSLSGLSINDAGTLAAVVRSDAGSDWQSISVLDPATGRLVDGTTVVAKFTDPQWLPDGRSFLYTAFPEADQHDGTAASALGREELRVHTVGTPLDADRVVHTPSDVRMRTWPIVSDDGRWLVLHEHAGTERRTTVAVVPLAVESSEDGARTLFGEPLTLEPEPRADIEFLGAAHERLWFRTTINAARGRVVALNAASIGATTRIDDATVVVPEADGTLIAAGLTASGLVTLRLLDVRAQVSRYQPDGIPLGDVPLPDGAVVSLEADPDSDTVLVGLSTLVRRRQNLVLDARTGTVRALGFGSSGDHGWDPPAITVERRHAISADGTRVPYWLAAAAGDDLSEPAATLQYGYGGFDIPVEADFRPGWAGWLASGGRLVVCNLRGGGEFGVEWYDAGRRQHKQNVFDDFIAVSEHLVATGITTPRQLAAYGRSNGGLLVGAVMTQRPDLYACALPQVGVLDLLRFHRFTIGAAWISDYGDPDVAADFAVAHSYSPLHNLHAGMAYPATLVLTGDHDDRVVPAHSLKFLAELQHAHAGEAPVVGRIESQTGHGAGKSSQMVADEWADLLAFAAEFTGLPERPGDSSAPASDRSPADPA